MKHLKQRLIGILIVSSLFWLVLLLNITAPNPTGRRYSSEMPLTTGQGNAAAIGLSGEQILAKDLGLPRNEASDQRKCICNNGNPSPAECNVCAVSVAMAAPYRRPDFFGKGFIAEAKNTQGLFYEGREFEQISDYAIAARALGVPLYVYTRVNTNVDRQFEGIVASTGGAVVRYFSVPNWSDPVDNLARNGFLLSVGGLLLLIGGSALLKRAKADQPAPAPKTVAQPPRGALSKAIDHVEDAQAFSKRLNETIRDQLD
jgi:hypothetical protein